MERITKDQYENMSEEDIEKIRQTGIFCTDCRYYPCDDEGKDFPLAKTCDDFEWW